MADYSSELNEIGVMINSTDFLTSNTITRQFLTKFSTRLELAGLPPRKQRSRVRGVRQMFLTAKNKGLTGIVFDAGKILAIPGSLPDSDPFQARSDVEEEDFDTPDSLENTLEETIQRLQDRVCLRFRPIPVYARNIVLAGYRGAMVRGKGPRSDMRASSSFIRRPGTRKHPRSVRDPLAGGRVW